MFFSVLLFAGCSTLDGVKNDIVQGYEAVSDAFTRTLDPLTEKRKKLPEYDGVCPPVSIRPDLSHMVDFVDPANPGEATKLSEVTMISAKNTCRVEGDAILMQVDIALSGKTGPKARVKPNDKPSFAYPYFIAIVDHEGNVLSKEIFATSLAYGSNQNELTQTETIFQNMPVPKSGQGATYSAVVGFQLSPEQLEYNRKTGLGEPLDIFGSPPAQNASQPANR